MKYDNIVSFNGFSYLAPKLRNSLRLDMPNLLVFLNPCLKLTFLHLQFVVGYILYV